MNENKIDAAVMMRIFEEFPYKVQEIEFIRATGPLKGSIKSCKVTKIKPKTKTKTGVKSKRKYLHKDKWTVPLFDVTAQRIVTPRFTNIIGFNGKKVFTNEL